MSLADLGAHVRRHGVGQTLLTLGLRRVRRVVDCDLMLVQTAHGAPRPLAALEEYVTREVGAAEFCAKSKALPEDGHQRPWAFERGDRCFANFYHDDIVGYTFYGRHPTRVRPGLVFRFPEGMLYTYASYTHPDHRGRALAGARANARRLADGAAALHTRVVWYISIDNSDSLASAKSWGPGLLGYVGYVRARGRFHCFASPSCRRLGIELAEDPSAG
jgi:hypothetical protein